MSESRYYVFGNERAAPTVLRLQPISKETLMKSLAYVVSAFLVLAIAAPSIASAGDWHHHHHHFHHHH
jgi:hypothetical protein